MTYWLYSGLLILLIAHNVQVFEYYFYMVYYYVMFHYLPVVI